MIRFNSKNEKYQQQQQQKTQNLFLFFPCFLQYLRILVSNEVFYHFAYIILLSFRLIFTFFVNLCCLHCVKLRITETLNKNTIKIRVRVSRVFLVCWFSLFLFLHDKKNESLNLNNNNHSNINPLVNFRRHFFSWFAQRV